MVQGREYKHGGKTYRLVPPSPDHQRRLAGVEQRARAHQLNGYVPGCYQNIADTWAVMLGITSEEAAELPLRLLIEILMDCDAEEGFRKRAAAYAATSGGEE